MVLKGYELKALSIKYKIRVGFKIKAKIFFQMMIPISMLILSDSGKWQNQYFLINCKAMHAPIPNYQTDDIQ
jgi:hypothetical protein